MTDKQKLERVIAQQELLDRKLNLALGMLDAMAAALSELAAAQNPEKDINARMAEFYAGADGGRQHHENPSARPDLISA